MTKFLWNQSVDPQEPPAQIEIERGDWEDSSRGGRKVPYKIYAPVGQGGERFPVILWSHGLGGSREGAGFISRYIASHGYIVVHIQHAGTDSELWEGKPGHPWDVIRQTKIPRKATLQRLQDVPFAVDQLYRLAEGGGSACCQNGCGAAWNVGSFLWGDDHTGYGRTKARLWGMAIFAA